MVTRFDGSGWLLDSKETLATNGIVHEDMMKVMADVFEGRDLPELPNPLEYARSHTE